MKSLKWTFAARFQFSVVSAAFSDLFCCRSHPHPRSLCTRWPLGLYIPLYTPLPSPHTRDGGRCPPLTAVCLVDMSTSSNYSAEKKISRTHMQRCWAGHVNRTGGGGGGWGAFIHL